MATAAKKDVVTEPATEVSTVDPVVSIEPYRPGDHNLERDWETFAQEGDAVLGHELLKEDQVDRLIKVPFVITRVRYHEGVPNQAMAYRPAFVSVEAVVAPGRVLQVAAERGRLVMSELSVNPLEHIVFNDSGAGILRQITQYLYERKIIGLPDPIVGKGPRGQCSWDLPPQEWTFGTDRGWNGIDIRLACPRGIQISKQYNDDFPDAETRYLG